MNDTPPEVAEMVRARLMSLPGATRLMMGVQSFEAARAMVEASLPRDLAEGERKKLLYERIYGEPLPEFANLDR